MTRSLHDAEGPIQKTLLRAWKNYKRFEINSPKPRTTWAALHRHHNLPERSGGSAATAVVDSGWGDLAPT
nr:hypothetical protein [Mycobacterium uberis]